jgi:RHS repeat-associated protein
VETTTLLFVYHGTGTGRCRNLLYEKDLNSSTITKHFYANGLQIAKLAGSTTRYFHPDHLGSTRLTTTPAAGNNFSSNYKPFGPQYGASGVEVFKYTGQLHDTVTGLYPFGARLYDPNVGRFITQDPLLGSPRDPQSLNRYAYARNNPLRYTDRNGLSFTTSSLLARLGPTAANIVGAVATVVASMVNNVVTQAVSGASSRAQVIPSAVKATARGAASSDSSKDEASDDPYYRKPDDIMRTARSLPPPPDRLMANYVGPAVGPPPGSYLTYAAGATVDSASFFFGKPRPSARVISSTMDPLSIFLTATPMNSGRDFIFDAATVYPDSELGHSDLGLEDSFQAGAAIGVALLFALGGPPGLIVTGAIIAAVFFSEFIENNYESEHGESPSCQIGLCA